MLWVEHFKVWRGCFLKCFACILLQQMAEWRSKHRCGVKKSSNIRITKTFLGKSAIRYHCRSMQFCAGYCRAQKWRSQLNYLTNLCGKKMYFFLKLITVTSWITFFFFPPIITSCFGTSDEQQMVMLSMKVPKYRYFLGFTAELWSQRHLKAILSLRNQPFDVMTSCFRTFWSQGPILDPLATQLSEIMTRLL